MKTTQWPHETPELIKRLKDMQDDEHRKTYLKAISIVAESICVLKP